MILKDSEECLCGSGKTFKSCCKKKIHRTKNIFNQELFNNPSRLNHELYERMKQTDFKICLHPDKEQCEQPIKNAHAIQNNGVLSLLAVDGHVMISDLLNVIREETTMKRVGKKDATTFYGFCSYHDSAIFADIELKEYEKTEKQNFLFAYRACAQEYHKKQRAIKSMQNIVKDKPMILLDDTFVMNYKLSSLSLNDVEEVISDFNSALMQEKFDVIETFVYEFNSRYDFAVTTTFCPAVDLKGKELNDIYSISSERLKSVFLTFLPTQDKSYFIFSVLKSDINKLQAYMEQIRKLDEEKLKTYINNVIPMYSENIVLSPRLWDKWTRFSRKEFDKIITGPIGEFDKILKNEIPFSSYEDFLKGIEVQNGLLDVLEKPKYNLFKL